MSITNATEVIFSVHYNNLVRDVFLTLPESFSRVKSLGFTLVIDLKKAALHINKFDMLIHNYDNANEFRDVLNLINRYISDSDMKDVSIKPSIVITESTITLRSFLSVQYKFLNSDFYPA